MIAIAAAHLKGPFVLVTQCKSKVGKRARVFDDANDQHDSVLFMIYK